MGVRLIAVKREHLEGLFGLKVADGQKGFVASNEISLAEAAYETATYPLGIWDGDVLVGFLQLLDVAEHAYREPQHDTDSVYLWRFMIGTSHQGKGYGRQALQLALEWARGRGRNAMTLSTHPNNAAAIALYESMGFRPTGDMDHDEANYRVELKRDVQD
jgi:diamine N-acetyltransferase